MSPVSRSRAVNQELRNQPAYPIAEAGRYLKVPAATLRAWFVGRKYATASGERRFRPIVVPSSTEPTLLSFFNLIEAHVIRALRIDHGVSVRTLRTALDYAERTLKVDRLLLSPDLKTGAGELFLEHYGDLLQLSTSGQMAMRQVLMAYLERVEWDEWQFPVRLYPFLTTESVTAGRPIVIDAGIAFGRPVVASKGVTTAVIAERIDAGESVRDVAADYGLTDVEIERAILYERAA